ncbi:MAG: GatB/YqeY domain-containing protein [Myxococcaceae bacterium]|nr:MAG: GatB/YqeY domain-containing protein [Myxococcaceae bacterium]
MATLKERIAADLKDAMRAKNELTLSVLRMLKSAVTYKEVEPGGSALDDDAVQKVINTLIKQRRESVDQFRSGGRPELAEKEEQEIAVLQKYLPQQLSAEELSALVKTAISESGAQGPKDMGSVMKNVNPKIQGRAEGRAVSDEVKAQLSKMS